MILYKSIALQYGRYLATGQSDDKYRRLGFELRPDDIRSQRQQVLDELAKARVYLVDHRAANYLDSLRLETQGRPGDQQADARIKDYVRKIDLPRDIIWVEYDSQQLWRDRMSRGLTALSDSELKYWLQRGFLFDNRSPEQISIQHFAAMSEQSFFEPPVSLILGRSRDGRPDFDKVRWEPARNFVNVSVPGGSHAERSFRDLVEEHKGHVLYEMVTVFMLFAALAAREDDLLLREAPNMTPGQAKTARKFGKTWVTNAERSHVTVRIGPAGERHLIEREARQRFQEGQPSGRSSPTEHWVAQHERRYADGKVVMVKSHQRGRPADRNIPVRVVGPKLPEQSE